MTGSAMFPSPRAAMRDFSGTSARARETGVPSFKPLCEGEGILKLLATISSPGGESWIVAEANREKSRAQGRGQ